MTLSYYYYYSIFNYFAFPPKNIIPNLKLGGSQYFFLH